ncbi:MAG: amidohydrolase, partial [Thaumarchaeota archaeon]
MASKTILIKGGTLVTMNRERRIIKDGAILVEDGRITSIGKADEFGGEKADRVIDASGKYIFPGFINCHTHMFQVLLRDVAMDMVLLDWLKTSIWPS